MYQCIWVDSRYTSTYDATHTEEHTNNEYIVHHRHDSFRYGVNGNRHDGGKYNGSYSMVSGLLIWKQYGHGIGTTLGNIGNHHGIM